MTIVLSSSLQVYRLHQNFAVAQQRQIVSCPFAITKEPIKWLAEQSLAILYGKF